MPFPSFIIQEILPFPSPVRLMGAEGLLKLTNVLSTCRMQLQINVLGWVDKNTNKSNHNQKKPLATQKKANSHYVHLQDVNFPCPY